MVLWTVYWGAQAVYYDTQAASERTGSRKLALQLLGKRDQFGMRARAAQHRRIDGVDLEGRRLVGLHIAHQVFGRVVERMRPIGGREWRRVLCLGHRVPVVEDDGSGLRRECDRRRGHVPAVSAVRRSRIGCERRRRRGVVHRHLDRDACRRTQPGDVDRLDRVGVGTFGEAGDRVGRA